MAEFIFILLVIVAIFYGFEVRRRVVKENQPSVYSYSAKAHIMTESEEDFFRMLLNAVSDRYYVFPQVHLSALVSHSGPEREALFAFRHVNQKSVDYVLCDKSTLKPTYAIELDDYTHRVSKSRYDRDVEVERIFQEAGTPLVRFRNYQKLSAGDILEKLTQAYKQNESDDVTHDTPNP